MGESANRTKSKQGAIDFVSGCVAGTACVFTGQPLDTVKIKMQTYSHVYRNSFRCFMDILRTEGGRGLYAGTSPALLANVLENSVLFLAYGQCQNVIAYLTHQERSKLSPLYNACAGSFTSVFTCIVLCPTELIKCRLQTSRESALVHESTRQKTMFSVIKQVIRQDGFLGFYRGLSALFIREFPANFFFFGGYEGTKKLLVNPGEKNPAAWKFILAGGVGGVTFWGPTYPIDVVKSKLQIWQGTGRPPTLFQTARNMFKTEGIGSFYKGVWPTLIRAFPANAATFLAYEWSKSALWEWTE